MTPKIICVLMAGLLLQASLQEQRASGKAVLAVSFKAQHVTESCRCLATYLVWPTIRWCRCHAQKASPPAAEQWPVWPAQHD